ncbi:SIR2-like protein [Chitinophaga niastensis]|uniref:SIR2-like protein n=1 Tax=Chitinophaga niastensis TaxID=536980 RepID=A0A2P8H854_CHINA|nr:SIR2 family protein [Chitinophaga niastensis]PSL42369.1 SIR2-like protein [Chitinophaga niastensis]
MQLEKIFDLVRKEDVVLWIGSGFSLYAGYPNGKQLSSTIYQSLSPAEKAEISENLFLADLTEQYVRLKAGSRNSLVALLRKELNKAPQSTKWHEVLAKIPHLKTIVTTNYDHLFELAYKQIIYPIIFEKDVSYRDDRVELIKLHGDINHPDTIVITKTDYAEFFRKNTQGNLIWTLIKERISNKSIVFIGYDMEDDNISNMFKEITEALGTNRKEMFLIAPGLKQHKIDYLVRMGIQYLNFKGEPFVEKLYDNIKDRISTDFSNGDVSVETLGKFFAKNDLAVDLKTVGDRFKISSVKSLRDLSNGRLKLQFKNDKQFIKSFYEFIHEKKLGQLCIEGNQLESFKLLLNDVNIITDNLGDYQLQIRSIPKREGTVSLLFEDGSEFENVEYKLYTTQNSLEIISSFKNCTYTLQACVNVLADEDETINATFKFTQSPAFNNVNDAIASYKLCLNLAKGNAVTVFLPNVSNGILLKPRNSNFPTDSLESNIAFFECLKKIEKLYNVRFINIGEYSSEEFDNAFKLVQFANEGHYVQDWDEELEWEIIKDSPLDLLLTIQKGAQFEAESTKLEQIKLFDKEITLGYLILEPLDLYIVNLTEVINKETSIVKIRSKSKKIKLRYTQTPRSDNP